MSPVWSAETLARLRELVAEGLSSTAIAAKLGLTRNAVCGARTRHHIPPPQPLPKPKSAPRHDRAPTARFRALQRELPRPERPAPVRDPHPVGKDGVALVQLEWWMCRWPLPQSHGSAMRFCGQPAVTGQPYCGEHAQKSRRYAA
jgi:GcrA cell cycle regulator